MLNINKNTNYHFLSLILVLVVAGSLVFPVMYFENIGLRLSDILVLVVVPVLYFYKPVVPKEKLFYIYMFFVFGSIFSLIYGYAFLGVPVSCRDWNEIVRVSSPLLLVMGLLNADKDFLIKTLNKFFYYGSFFVIFVALIEFFFPRSVGPFVAGLYNSGGQLDYYIKYNAKRIFVTGSDPNTGAAIVLLFLEFNIICFLIKRNLSLLLTSLLLLLVLLSTGSRTGLVAFVVSLLVIVLITEVKYKRYNIIIFFVVSGILLLIVPNIPYIYIGFSTLFTGTNTSVLARVDNVQEVLLLFKQSMFFGWGPAKEIHPTVVDGEYILLLRRYGLVGLSSICVFMLYNIIRILKNRTLLYLNDNGVYLLAILVVGYSASLSIIMLTNNFISGYQLLLPYMLLSFLVHFKISIIRKIK